MSQCVCVWVRASGPSGDGWQHFGYHAGTNESVGPPGCDLSHSPKVTGKVRAT